MFISSLLSVRKCLKYSDKVGWYMKVGIEVVEDTYWVPSPSIAGPKDTNITESLVLESAHTNLGLII